ncbi:FeoA family protein [Mitsuaria sp. GD03876]|uniref:FeoA family protein n=1 Tax=Mitsuaria sp. GD03876 TaxID=2975399 RepID=UPI002448E1D5|nr:FeoA family protein [Mitsuaria sp. GD03876]MDH0866984.1 ferrous iron transport protein A [Mitsuaria sp. GD03876]
MSAVLPVPTLAQAAIGQAHRVQALQAPAHAPEWKQWLEELGFVPGEHVAVLARAMPGADPLVVRIGQSTFALRRAEADCVVLEGGAHGGLTSPADAGTGAPGAAHA